MKTVGRVVAAGCVAIERMITNGRVVAAGCEAEERISHPQRCYRWDSLRPVADRPCLRRRRKRKAGEDERDEEESKPQRRAAD